MKKVKKRKKRITLDIGVSYSLMFKKFTSVIQKYHSKQSEMQILTRLEKGLVRNENNLYLDVEQLRLVKSTAHTTFNQAPQVILDLGRSILLEGIGNSLDHYPPKDYVNGTKDILTLIVYNLYQNAVIEIPITKVIKCEELPEKWRGAKEQIPLSWSKQNLIIWTVWKRVLILDNKQVIAHSSSCLQGIYVKK